MALPVTITGISTAVAPVGPFKSSGGNYYFFGVSSSVATTLQAYKSTAPDTSWASIATKTGFATGIQYLSAYQVADVIHMVVTDGATTSTNKKYQTFNMSSETFVTAETIVSAENTQTSASANAYNSSIVVRSTGEVVVHYNAVRVSTFAQTAYKRRTGVNTWSAAVAVSATGINALNPLVVLGASDRLHFLLQSTNATQRHLTSANVLGTAASAGTTGLPLDATSFDDGTGAIRCICTTPTSAFYWSSADNPTTALGAAALSGTPARIFNDSRRAYQLFRNSTDSDLYARSTSNYGALYNPNTPVQVGTIAAVDANLSKSLNVYQRGVKLVAGYILNDNGTLFYNEVEMPTADAWNRLDKATTVTLSNVDKTATCTAGGGAVRSSKLNANGAAGKYYVEFLLGSSVGVQLGIKIAGGDVAITTTSNAVVNTATGAVTQNNSSLSVSIGTCTTSDVVCVAWDTGAERIWFRKNNDPWNNDGAADPATGTNGLDVSAQTSVAYAAWVVSSGAGIATLRTETAELTQSPPSGFTSWMGEALSTNITGTLSVTEADDTISAAGTVAGGAAVTGTLNVTESNDTVAATGTIAVSGTLGVAEANDTISAAATVRVGGTLSITEANDTLSAAATIGYPTVTGTLNVTEANDTVSAAGGPVARGTLSATEANDTISAAGTVAWPVITGTLNTTEANDTISATASVSLGGALSLTEDNDTLAAAGTVEAVAAVTGTLNVTEANDAISAAGTTTVSGTLTVTEANDVLAALATITIGGALNVAESNDTLSSAGTVSDYSVVTGTLNVTEADDTISALATVTGEAVIPPVVGGGYYTPPRPYLVTGVGYGVMPPIVGEAHGVVLGAGAGVGQGQLPRFAGQAEGSIGTAGRSLARFTIKAVACGQRGQAGTAIARLGGISATSIGRAAVSGKGVGMIMNLKGAAVGDNNDDEAAAVTFLLAA